METDDCPECGCEDSEDEKDIAGSVEDSFQEGSLEDRGRWELALVWWRVSVVLFLLCVVIEVGGGDGVIAGLFPVYYVCPRSGVQGLKTFWFAHFVGVWLAGKGGKL